MVNNIHILLQNNFQLCVASATFSLWLRSCSIVISIILSNCKETTFEEVENRKTLHEFVDRIGLAFVDKQSS